MNNSTKGCVIAIVLLVSLPGCWGKKKKKAEAPKATTTSVEVASGDNTALRSFFDEDLGEFVMDDEATKGGAYEVADAAAHGNDYAWMDKQAAADKSLETIQFDFDKYSIREDQREIIAADAQAAKTILEKNPNAIIVVEGHACSSAGSAVYNFALGEKRSKVASDTLVASGVDAEHLKIVSRGSDMPVLVDGTPVKGGREEQAPNRRVEFLVVNA